MRILFFIFLLNSFFYKVSCQNADSLTIFYYESKPFAFKNGENYTGIEFDIFNEYIAWLKGSKNINLVINYKNYSNFNSFYTDLKSSKKTTIGLGSVSNTAERQKEVDFTNGYMKNVAFCITNGNAPDIKSKNKDEIVKVLGAMSAITISNTVVEKHCNELKKLFLPDLKIKYQNSSEEILNEVAKNILNFGYVDAVDFWFYLKANPGKFLKMQRSLSQSKDQLAYILPKGSKHKALFNEFFNSFKLSKNYRIILEKYVGSYMTQNLAVN